jgi:hypothetical protein
MAFIYCDKCKWQQDDFWTERYNPASSFYDTVKEDILRHRLNEPLGNHFDSQFLKDSNLVGKTWRDYFLWKVERIKSRILRMRWETEEQYRNDPDKRCPECGNTHLIMD